MRAAFWLVCASVLLSLLPSFVELIRATMNDVPPDVLAFYRRGSPTATAEAIKTTVVFSEIVHLGVYLVTAAVFVLVARKMRTGRNWARWSTAALLLIGAVSWSTRELGSPLDTLAKVLIAGCALAAIVCMFVRASRPHFTVSGDNH
ncbi:hypothetical protein [Pseudonocardia spinosispora]|uniref:hypothetical protein n=1 Tax=Pseudonocardia spinosispora TaxID=103441 RepID=UPI00040F60FD|nr:hypothetical protein [Pseudonocardia spinosispora]